MIDMDIQSSNVNGFRLRLYKWAKQDAQREVQEDFPFLRQIKGSSAWRILALMESLSEDDRLQLASSLVKGIAGEAALVACNEEWNHIDVNWRNKFRHACIIEPITYEIEEKFLRKIVSGELSFKIRKKEFKSLLKSELQSVVGDLSHGKGDILIYQKDLADWSIRTVIDIGGSQQLRYDHQVIYANSQRELSSLEPSSIHFLRWLGMGETSWDYLTEEDTPLAAKTLSDICSHFMQALPSLLNEESL
jgi:hypothetical protein